MIDYFRPTSPYAAQTQRLVARAQFGAADAFEIAAVAARLEPNDLDGWIKAWMDVADAAQTEAEDYAAAGHGESAMTRFFHASTYYQQSDIFTPGGDPRRPEAFRKAQSAFRRGADIAGDIRVITLRCGNDTYEGYYCLPRGRTPVPVPAVLFIGGLDAYSEETYFSGKGMLDRGMALILVDFPGRGSSIYLKGIPTRPDYEVPVKAAVDWMCAQPEIDPERIGIAGISLAGYYAPRAAAFEGRFKALLCWGGICSLVDDIYDYQPATQEQFKWVTGSDDDAATREKLKRFDLSDVASQITCPTLVVHGSQDRICRLEGAQKFFSKLDVREKRLRILEGPGAGHCNYDDWRHVVPMSFDWMRDRLQAGSALATRRRSEDAVYDVVP